MGTELSARAIPSKKRWWLLPAAIALGFALLQGIGVPRITFGGDSETYALVSLRLYGTPEAQARQEIAYASCLDKARSVDRGSAVDPLRFRTPDPSRGLRRACATLQLEAPTARSLRYEAIFNGRVGYPLLAGLPIKLLGISLGFWITSVAVTALGGFLVAVLLAAAGLGTAALLAGELIFLLGPLGRWGVYPLAEGALNTAVVAALLGAWWLVQRRLLLGGIVWLLGLAAVATVKYSGGAMMAACLVGAAVGCMVTVRRYRHAGTAILAVGGASMAAGVWLLSSALGLPGLSETLQDTFTRHFHHRPVDDVWNLLAQLEVVCWRAWLRLQASAPALLLAAALGLWLLFRRRSALGWLAAAAAGLGLFTIVAHPLVYEADRLGALMWMPAVLGLPFLLDGVRLHWRTGRMIAVPHQSAGDDLAQLGDRRSACTQTGGSGHVPPLSSLPGRRAEIGARPAKGLGGAEPP
jgi:hypothetical protein